MSPRLPRGDEVAGRCPEAVRTQGQPPGFITDAKGNIIADSQENIRRAVEKLGVQLSYNVFAEKTLVTHGARTEVLDDALIDRTWLRVDKECHFRGSFGFFEKVVFDTARHNSFHPVRDYLNGLTWDGTPRIDRWLETYGGAEDSDYVRAVSSIVLIAAVRRVRQPGCKYDEMLVLESPQGWDKSSALRALCQNGDWFSDDLPLNVDAKRLIEATLGKWIIEASELTGKRKSDRDHLKSMLSRAVDGPARLAYAHIPVSRERHFILLGTTNSAAYLNDMTGARRFWPVAVQKFDVAAIVRDRDQLWAEAGVPEKKGESIRLPEALWPAATEQQEARREIDAWEQPLADALDLWPPSGDGKEKSGYRQRTCGTGRTRSRGTTRPRWSNSDLGNNCRGSGIDGRR